MAQSGVSPTVFTASLLIVSLIFAVTGFIIYRRQQRYMRNEILGIMQEYMPVDANKVGESTAISDEYEESEFTIS